MSEITNTASSSGGGDPPATPPVTAAPAAPDPFDPIKLRLSQQFGAGLGVKKALLTVPVRKPSKEWWVRVHPDADYHLDTAVIELKEDRETYLVAPHLWPALATESTFSPRALFTAINTTGVVFIWPVRLPGSDGNVDEWSRTALEATESAKTSWVRVQANMSLGAYEVLSTTTATMPAWPDVPFKELLKLAFRDHYIDSLNHPVLKRLRGL